MKLLFYSVFCLTLISSKLKIDKINGQTQTLSVDNFNTKSINLNSNKIKVIAKSNSTNISDTAVATTKLLDSIYLNKLLAISLYQPIGSYGSGTLTSLGLSSSNLTITGSPVISSGTISISLPNTGTSGTYEKTTTDAQGRITSGYNQIINNNVSRSLNSNYTISTTQESFVCYTIQINITIGLSASTGTTTLQYSTNSGSSWISLPEVSFNPPLLTIGLLTSQKLQVNGWIPANALVRILTATSGGGTTTFTYITGQERY